MSTPKATPAEKLQPNTAKPKKVLPPQLVRGMHDILPVDWDAWEFVISELADLARAYGFMRIEPPVLEKSSLFSRAIGTTTDIVEKEMYSFTDQSGDHLSLRPEYTAGLARAYVEHGLHTLPQPVKLYAYGPVFRHERPQAGRYRGFWQFDCEILGEAGGTADAQLIVLSAALFESLRLPVTIQINTVGCQLCRPGYRSALTEYYRTRKSELCEDCKRRLVKNPLRLLDCKQEKCRAIARSAPQLVDHLCEECNKHFTRVLEYLDEVELTYQLNPYLVRGLDYYTRTVFEIWPEGDTTSALLAGGRYDNLIQEFGGQPTPAVGFAGGIERIVLELKQRQVTVPTAPAPEVFLAALGEAPRKKALKLFEQLRRQGIRVAESFTKEGLKQQLELANKLKVKFALLIGQKELTDGTIIVRDMENGIQEIVDIGKTVEEVRRRLATRTEDISVA